MERLSWDETFMAIAETMARRSRCVRGQIGCVIATPENRIIATGYNGPPARYPMSGDCSATCLRNRTLTKDVYYNDCVSIHAEANALLFCDRSVRQHATLYSTSMPCMSCAKLIGNSGVRRVVVRESVADISYRAPEECLRMLHDSGVDVVRL